MHQRNFPQFRKQEFLVPLKKIVEKDFQEDYELKHKIGFGGYSICRVVKQSRTKKLFVAKVIRHSEYKDEEDLKFLQNEIRLQANLKHKNLVVLNKVYVQKGKFTLITELCCYGCLQDLIIYKRQILGEGERRHIIHGILCGARYLHRKGIVHGDIKPLNIFVSKDLTAKIGDFGMAHYQNQDDCFGGTLNYFAPELFKFVDQKHTSKTDVWAIGCTAYFTYTGDSLFTQATGEKTRQVRRKIVNNFCHTGWYELPNHVRSFIQLMVRKDPASRPDCSKLIRHPFLMLKAKRYVNKEVLRKLTSCLVDSEAYK